VQPDHGSVWSYPPKFALKEFCELRLLGILRSWTSALRSSPKSVEVAPGSEARYCYTRNNRGLSQRSGVEA